MSDGFAAFLTMSAMFGVPLFGIAALVAWMDWVSPIIPGLSSEQVRRKAIWARAMLTAPLWSWWALVPVVVLAGGAGLYFGMRALWRLSFPGTPPTDHDGPSQGGGYR